MLRAVICVLLAVGVEGGAQGCCKHLPTVRAGILPATREPWWKFHAGELRCQNKTVACGAVVCKECWSGLVPDLHARLAEHMGYEYELVAAPAGATDEDLLHLVDIGAVTLLPHELSVSSFTPYMKANFVATQPFVSFTYSALVRSDYTSSGAWSLFEPFALGVWLAILVTIVVLTGAFFVFAPVTSSRVQDLAQGFEFVVTSLLGGMEYNGVREDGPAGRVLRGGFLFFILIVTATYTANLASILTAQKVGYNGPRDMDQLKTSQVCNFDREGVRLGIGEHARVVATPRGSPALWEATEDGRRQCVNMLLDKSVDAVVANVLELRQMQRDFGHCTSLLQVPGITFNPRHVVFLGSGGNAEFIQNVTEAIVGLQTNKLLMQMMDDNYAAACTYSSSSNTQIEMQHLWGLFIILAIVIALAALTKLAHSFTTPPVEDGVSDFSSVDTTRQLELLHRIATDIEELKSRKSNPLDKMRHEGVV